ncbi:MAG: tRNA uracil 4-sulfurtransferase ThiI [Actinomycetota bacterium]
MNRQLVIAHYHEIGLKGGNRSYFEQALANNIRSALGDDCTQVRLISGRLLVEIRDGASADPLRKVFGLSSFSYVISVKPTIEDMTAAALQMAQQSQFASFRIRARRGNSSFPQKSQFVNETIGRVIKDRTGARVDLSNAEWTCYIELVEDMAFLYSDRVDGPGGLPVGTSGRVLALLSGGIDSPVAAWQIARRGANVDFIHFHGQPFSDPSSARQATRLKQQLMPWLRKSKLWMVPFGEIQSQIVTSAPQELRIVLYRRMMMRIAEAIALENKGQALVTGESLGQVASQTLPNLTATNEVVSQLPVLRPLIGFDKLQIEALAKSIGTYQISIEPHQDCCVLFIPRRVTTAARPDALKQAEERLDLETLLKLGVQGAEIVPK